MTPNELIFGIEPAHVLGVVIAIGGSILGLMFKINRCLGKQEGRLDGLEKTLERIAKSLLTHLDKPK